MNRHLIFILLLCISTLCVSCFADSSLTSGGVSNSSNTFTERQTFTKQVNIDVLNISGNLYNNAKTMTLIFSTTLTGSTNYINIENLDGNNDRYYALCIEGKSSNGVANIWLNFNSDTASNYSFVSQGGSAQPSSAIIVLGRIGSYHTSLDADIQVSTGAERGVFSNTIVSWFLTDPHVDREICAGSYKNKTTNIISIQIFCSFLYPFSAGTKVSLYALR
jgi:hypothetical protein